MDQSDIDSESDTPDLQVLDSAGQQQSQRTQGHVAYLNRFNPVHPLFEAGQKMTKDRDIVRREFSHRQHSPDHGEQPMTGYFNKPPRINHPSKTSILLSQRVARQDREEPDWARKLKCAVRPLSSGEENAEARL